MYDFGTASDRFRMLVAGPHFLVIKATLLGSDFSLHFQLCRKIESPEKPKEKLAGFRRPLNSWQ
jgi:hypothetical protein